MERLEEDRQFIKQRRLMGGDAKIFAPHPDSADGLASMIAAGGVVVLPWYQKGRSTLFLATCHDNPDSTKMANVVKGRAPTQTLGISYIPELVRQVADIDNSKPLQLASRRLKRDPIDILNECYKHSVGLMFKVVGELPEAVTMVTEKGNTVLLMGAIQNEENYDAYNGVLGKLYRIYGKAIAGTSLNPTTRTVYALSEQEEAFREFGCKVDGFVMYDEIPSEPLDIPPVSSTLIDLSGDYPVIVREGSVSSLDLQHIF